MIRSADVRVQRFESFEAAAPSWQRFEGGGDLHAVQRRAWIEHWYRTVGAAFTERLCVVEVGLGGAPAMLLPLGELRLGTAACVTFLGGDITDYHAPLLAADLEERLTPGALPIVWEAVLAALPEHDALRLHKQPARIGDQPNPLLALEGTEPHEVNHWTAIEGEWETFYEGLVNARLRGDTRRKRRRLGERGTLAFSVADSPAAMRTVAEQMIEQKIARYVNTGTYSLFNDPSYREFFREPSPELLDSGMLHASSLTLDGEPLATHWGLVDRGRFYFIMAGFAAGEWERFSPGRLLIEDLLRWCAGNGVREFDFTIGDEAFKRTWANRESKLYRTTAARNLRGSAFLARDRFADWVRDRPGLHRRISRLRNALGR